MSQRIVRPRAQRLAVALCAFALLLVNDALGQQQPAKRPLRHSDYDTWRSIQSPLLSRDGKFLAYALTPQDGDGEVVVRNLVNGAEWRFPRGSRPLAPSLLQKSSLAKSAPTASPVGRLAFTADGRFLVFPITPSVAESKKAKGVGKAAEPARNALGLVDLKTGTLTRIPRVKTFQLPEEGTDVLVYHRESAADAERPVPLRGGGQKKKGAPKATPGDLVLRNLADHSERVFADVLEFTLSKDGRTLVFTVSSKEEAKNGVFAIASGSTGPPLALMAGGGKYAKLTWDEKQTQLAFVGTQGDAAADRAFRLYRWDRNAAAVAAARDSQDVVRILLAGPPPVIGAALSKWAEPRLRALKSVHIVELAAAGTPGLRPGVAVSDHAALTFSPDGGRVFFGVALPEEKEKAMGDEPDKAVVELWHWKDDFIQPMQKVKAQKDGKRSFRAVAHLKERKVVQLADTSMAEVSVSGNGGWALGTDDRPYRVMVGYGPNYADHFLVSLADGTRKPVLSKTEGALTLSPGGRHALIFDGKHWKSLSVPEGKVTNLTAKLGVRFASEDYDAPGTAPPYGLVGWSTDDRHVLLYDRFDVWQVAADGSGARNLTDGLGRREQLQLRHVRLDPRAKTIDTSKPLLLRAENLRTRATGFYGLRPGSPPERLLMAARNFGPPLKAKNADVLALTVSTFYEFPDLHITTSDFKGLTRVSDANPQKAGLLWGKAELVNFRSLDGAALHGVLIKPENFDPKKKYPLLVYIYERLSQSMHHFVDPRPGTSINLSYYASNGYLVFLPDIAYKVGYPGQSALKCVLPGVQAVVDRGFVDEKAIGIQGHSWGGYQIAYMVTQTNRFKAVAAGAPVANMTSAYSGIRWGSGLPRQFQYERTQSRIGGSLWQYPLRFVENSPVFMADRVRTPVLMLHNDQDDAVPWQQGIEFFLALRRLGKEAYLFNYPGELHGLRKRVNQKDYTVRLQEFFDHHLRGASRPAWMTSGIPYRPRLKDKTGTAALDEP
jgi:dipeptidyl aminopeptidase/acylaminoacyl peptidase